MTHQQYRGSTFGRHVSPGAEKTDCSKNKGRQLKTSPLNPWYLSDGIPDFSPQVDRNYDMLTMKRKMTLLESKNTDKEEKDFTNEEKAVTKKQRRSEEMKESKPAAALTLSSSEKNNEKKDSNATSSSPSSSNKELNKDNVTIAQSLLNSIKNEKEKAKALENKIMKSFVVDKSKS